MHAPERPPPDAHPARLILTLSLAATVGLGIGRFAYSLVLPDMREDLGWSYSAAGFMNTINAVGYLAGALVASRLIERVGWSAAIRGGTLACVAALATCALTGNFVALSLARLVLGVGAAAGFVAGGALAASIAQSRPERANFLLSLFYHGRIDLLVNNAGINVPKRSWKDMELEGWDQLVQVNLNGVLYCMRAVLPTMRKQQDGSIINVSSWAGRHVSKMPGPAYTTTKHAVLALTHSFNMDECVNGLRACCLMPGEVATPILKLRPVVPSEEEQARMLQSEDLGRTIAFIASMPARVCINELLISPTHNRGFIQTPHNRG